MRLRLHLLDNIWIVGSSLDFFFDFGFRDTESLGLGFCIARDGFRLSVIAGSEPISAMFCLWVLLLIYLFF